MTPTRRARVLLITGPGKGKTTSATGVVLRSLGHGKRVLLTRFCKAIHSGELAVLAKLDGVTILSGRCGMTPEASHPDYPMHVEAARSLFRQTMEMAHGRDVIVLDEICPAVARGLIEEGEVTAFLHSLRPDQTVVMTGRGAGPALIAAADTVSEILCLKHCYQRGVPAQEGIEL